ncbi:hypothetical protein BAUCODRAFT_123770 [Baudoinia panamericana UAMH 10762]|uniref:Dynamin-type G domain-containing protein n=1 Tax=Baudoinia panamericana (strain UAMH 10762) TaxID=717646 RepID=M2LLW8_BAUPA|nr:uncharacterized protein BAUCODRAFT_123770 [Baudoinia panamericana UAMH 10762]EMC95312.1 hypothetical protein BAUCODRAFT_123770 [Baudoinia panamericana UAMH 10762]
MPNDANALNQLLSSDQADLLNAIDRLRDHGLQRELDLPQLIVCGNQSAGKSSVLEAISRVRFPAGDKCVTRFALEIVLRRAPAESMRVSLVAANDKDKDYVSAFDAELPKLEDFADVVAKASEHLLASRAVDEPSGYSKHKLRVEISGPKQINVTLVDLPGLIQATSSEQGDGDIALVQSISERYMQSPKSIILAVMEAPVDAETQPIFQLARRVDPKGERTLGILTKPDRLELGKEGRILRLIRNEDIPLALGWHVVKNREHAKRDVSPEKRDALEQDFFSSAPWMSLPPDLCGVTTLRTKLARTLHQSVARSLPKLIEDVEGHIKKSDQIAQKLGSPRPDYRQQLTFLGAIQQRVSKLVNEGLKAEYDDVFFSDMGALSGQCKPLRKRLRYLTDIFAEDMQQHGMRYPVNVAEDPGRQAHASNKLPGSSAITKLERGDKTIPLDEASYIMALEAFIQDNKGLELDGHYSPSLVGKLLLVQTSPWETITERYIHDCWLAVEDFFLLVLDDCTSKHTASAIQDNLTKDKMETARVQLDYKVQELLAPSRTNTPITKNPMYLARERAILGKTHEWGVNSNDSAQTGVVQLRAQVQALYDVVLSTFVDNVLVLAVENCLVRSLQSWLTTNDVLGIDEKTLHAVTAEPAHVVQLREHNSTLLDTLREVRLVFKKAAPYSAVRPALSFTQAPSVSPLDADTVDDRPFVGAEDKSRVNFVPAAAVQEFSASRLPATTSSQQSATQLNANGHTSRQPSSAPGLVFPSGPTNFTAHPFADFLSGNSKEFGYGNVPSNRSNFFDQNLDDARRSESEGVHSSKSLSGTPRSGNGREPATPDNQHRR